MKEITDSALLARYIDASGIQAHFSLNLADISLLLAFDAGEFLIERGVVSRYLYFLVDGKIKFFATSASGKRVTYGYSRSNGALGEANSLWGRKPTISVQAVEPCLLVAIPLDIYRETLFQDNVFLRYACKLLSERIVLLDNNISSLMSYNIEARLCAFILQNAEDDVFRVSLMECAEFTGTSYRHIIRVINSLCERGMLCRTHQQFKILDSRGLAQLAGDAYAYYM